jgi:RNA-directed DNA polymerase
MKDRAMQALYLLALEPIAETLGDLNSYGFRPERCTADAMARCFTLLSKSNGPEWVLEGDIKGCFDNISHTWVLNNIPTDKVILLKWLKAGFIEQKRLFSTETGTPQGGIISPVLANMVLDGLERQLAKHFPKQTQKRIPNPTGTGKSIRVAVPSKQVHLIRYADDFVITCTSREVLENNIKPLVVEFLAARGLELSQEKTKITHIDDGYDFLGWNFRKYKGKLLIKPSKANIRRLLEKIREVIKVNATAKQANLINVLNPIIYGWGNYHKGVVAGEIFSQVDHEIWKALWRWARRRHPNKGKRWIKGRYFHFINGRDWTFCTFGKKGSNEAKIIGFLSRIKSQRHIKIKSVANPFDPAWETYFEELRSHKMRKSISGIRDLLVLWRRQMGTCPICGLKIYVDCEWVIHHIQPRSKGGSDKSPNRMMLHNNCHRQYHSQFGLETGPLIRA